MKKSTLILIVAILGVLIAVPALYYFVYMPTRPYPLKKVTHIFPIPPEEGYWEYIYADYAGIYREEGLEVETKVVRSPLEMAQAFLAGEGDFIGIPEALRLRLMGSPVKVVLATMRTSFALFVKPGINSIKDVKSAAVFRASPNEYLLKEYILRNGLNPEVVSMKYMDFAGMLPALLQGQVDAAALGTIGRKASEAGFKILFSYPEEFPDYFMMGVSATEKTIAEKPEVVKAFVKAIYRSQVFLMEHKKEAIDYAVNVLKIDRETATFMYEWGYEGKYIGNLRIKPDLSVKSLEYTMKIVAKYNNLKEIPIEQCIDTRFIEQVKKELGVS